MSADVKAVTETVELALVRAGFAVYPGDSDQRPTLLAVHKVKGLLAIDVSDQTETAMVELNRRVAALRDDVGALADLTMSRRVVVLASQPLKDGWLTPEQASEPDWLAALPDRPVDPGLIDELATQIAPTLTFVSPRRGPLNDEGLEEREARRVTLDAQQASVAMRHVEDVLLITGPPGSGKTLVLAARARWLATNHPAWEIQVLCYNRLLVPYLKGLVAGHPNIHVSTFGKFAFACGHRISLRDEFDAARDATRELRSAVPVVDALLIDEWQDFFPAWTDLCLALVRPGHGAVVLAGDPKQALYRESEMDAHLGKHAVEHAELSTPYRSTRQILEVTSALDAALEVESREHAVEGLPVDLVFADTKAEQARAIARDVTLLLRDGQRAPENIGILYTRKWDLGKLTSALRVAGIPHRVASAKQADELDLGEPTVKLMTVHSSKGYEFDVVFLFGLEDLPHPDSEDGAQHGRTGYVGATRAKDQLVITYSKNNTYLERIRKIPEDTLRPWVWPDDYPED